MNWKFQPLDRVVFILVGILSVLIGLLLWSGDRTLPQVREFTWQNKQISAEDTAFILSFNRPMNWPQVEKNLKITPELPGKVSWSGKRLAYTLLKPVPYGQRFAIQVAQAQEKSLSASYQAKTMRPFVGEFQSRDRAFVYLGVNATETGRLILSNLTRGQKTVLTPENLNVSEFHVYPYGDRILFTATEKAATSQEVPLPQLYTVSTGIQIDPPEEVDLEATAPGQVKLLLDNKEYQILKFDLSNDGQRIILQRALRQPAGGLGQVSLWQMQGDNPPEKINTQQGGDFLVAPDSETLVIAQGQGLAIIPLGQPNPELQTEPLDFLPQFGLVLSFAQDGSGAAMIKFNNDYTRSLFFVTNQGIQKELLRTKGNVLKAAFGPQRQFLYCILTRLLPGQAYIEEPYLAKINLSTGAQTPLLATPVTRETSISLAPDGSALLFNQATAPEPDPTKAADPNQGDPFSTNNIWLLPLSPAPTAQQPGTPQALVRGTTPHWL